MGLRWWMLDVIIIFMVSVEWKGKEFIFWNLNFIERLICLKMEWEIENLRMNKKMYIYDIWNGYDFGSSMHGWVIYAVSSTHSLIVSR